MKILELRDFGDNGRLPVLIMTTDSSIVRDNRPVFLPELSEQWRCDFMVAYQINRLGKSIAERFAHRYYNQMTIIVRFVPLDIIVDQQSGIETGKSAWPVWGTAFDGALSIGKWLPVSEIDTIEIKAPVRAVFQDIKPDIDKALSMLSRDMIIKTGDIIIPPEPLFSCPVKIGDHIEALLNGTGILKFNVK